MGAFSTNKSQVDVSADLTSALIRVDKEGPIHDYAWNPNSREFSVCYGCEYT